MVSQTKGHDFFTFTFFNMQVLKKYSNHDYSDAICFMAIFISHGTENKIFMKGEDRLDIEEHVFRVFRGNKCKGLLEKPKIFIFAVSVF